VKYPPSSFHSFQVRSASQLYPPAHHIWGTERQDIYIYIWVPAVFHWTYPHHQVSSAMFYSLPSPNSAPHMPSSNFAYMTPNMIDSVSQFIPSANTLRRAVKSLTTPHYTPQDRSSMSHTPPTFATNSLPSYIKEPGNFPASRLTILPREEEGREELPPYTCSLHKEGVFGQKMELRNPFERSRIRRWKRCYLILHGTKLDVHKPKRTSKSVLNVESSRPIGWKPGKLLASYTLQLAEVGTAPDYSQ
jgi:hypothetical protein